MSERFEIDYEKLAEAIFEVGAFSHRASESEKAKRVQTLADQLRAAIRRVDEPRTIPTRYVYAGEGKPMQVDLDEPEPNLGRCSGWVCGKVRHDPARTGYLHGEDDDEPYDVDGCSYCGRCHGALRKHETHKLPPELKPEPERKAEAEPATEMKGYTAACDYRLHLANKWGGCNQRSREHCEADLMELEQQTRAAVIEECAQAVDALADNMFAYGAVAADPNRKEHYNWMGQFYADAASAVRSLKGAR